MNNINLNELRNRAYKTACEHGFHDKELSNEHCLCLIVGELMEAVEADRKGRLGKKCKSRFEMDYNRYPALVEEEKRFKCSFKKNVKDTLPDELSDAVIRLLDLAGLRNISIDDFPEEAIYGASESCVGETFTESIYAISTLDLSSIISLIFSPISVPPGSLVRTTSYPFAVKNSYSFFICVDLPEPSTPSKDIK